MLPFTEEQLNEAVVNGRVTMRPHPTLPYHIYNYAPDIQYSSDWDEVTLTCRGLILDDEFNIIARPYRKFFNLGQVDLPIQFDTPVEVMDKADGSLGILYPNQFRGYSGHHTYSIATRGSFYSDQAKHATKLWKERYDGLHPFADYTMLFEIVYPENRIVLDYDGLDDLILLGAVANSTGYYVGPKIAEFLWYSYENGVHQVAQWPGPVVDVYEYKTISEAISNQGRKNKEGYVIRSHNFMVKLKEPDYLELHKLVSNLNPKTVWSQMAAGKPLNQICDEIPDEFHEYVRGIGHHLASEAAILYSAIIGHHRKTLAYLPAEYARKDFALLVKDNKYKAYLFALEDQKDIRAMIWDSLKPRGDAESVQVYS